MDSISAKPLLPSSLAPIPILELPPPSSKKKSSLSFHALTWNPFCNPFVFTFMHVMGGVPPLPKLPTFQRSNVFPSYPLSFHILGHSFARREIISLFLSRTSTLFAQNTRGEGACVKRKQTGGGGAFRDVADVLAGIPQPLIVGTFSFCRWRNFSPALQARCSSPQGRGAGSCCVVCARLPRNLAARFPSPSRRPRGRRERPRHISLVFPDRSLQLSSSKSKDCGRRESLPVLPPPPRRFQGSCCRHQARLAATRGRLCH